MDPISLAVLTAAATNLATKSMEGFAGEAGKSLWGRVKTALGWSADPGPADLAPELARTFDDDEAVARKVLELLKEKPSDGSAGVQQLVGQIQTAGGKVVIVGSQSAGRDMTNNF